MPGSRKRRSVKQGIGDGTSPMQEQRGVEDGKEPGAGPWRGLRFKQWQKLAVQGLCRTVLQGGKAQEEGKPFPVFMEAVEWLTAEFEKTADSLEIMPQRCRGSQGNIFPEMLIGLSCLKNAI